jgi:GNAT superfamily N-acetyltransferase
MGTRHLPVGVTIRAIRGDDLLLLERFYQGLSPDSIDARFHGAMRGIQDRAARSFCGPDHEHREGIVAVIRGPSGAESLIGHLCLEPTPDGDVEMAVAVADTWQHRGIGRALVVSGMDWARAHRFGRVRAAIRWSNPAIIGLLRSVGRPMTFRCDTDSELEALIDITGELPAAA